MKLTSTILASVALLGSAAEVPPQTLRQLTNDGHGDSPLEKEDIDPFKSQPIISSVDLAVAAGKCFDPSFALASILRRLLNSLPNADRLRF